MENDSWIPVAHKLPKPYTLVITYRMKNDKMEVGRYTHSNTKGHHWDLESDHEITHWHPFPEPPKV
jgi:hypothetical protein